MITMQLNRTLERAMLDIGSANGGNMPVSAILIVGWADGEVAAVSLPKDGEAQKSAKKIAIKTN